MNTIELIDYLGELSQHVKVDYEEKAFLIVMPIHFFASETFVNIMNKLKPIEGKYISAGKQSHWLVPKNIKIKIPKVKVMLT